MEKSAQKRFSEEGMENLRKNGENLKRWREENKELAIKQSTEGLKKSDKARSAARRVQREFMEKRLAARARNPRAAKGTEHALSTTWQLKDPNGKTHIFKNLNQFVRDHPSYFAERDTIWVKAGRGERCLARCGLSSLRPTKPDGSPKKKVEGSWKGWTYVQLPQKPQGG